MIFQIKFPILFVDLWFKIGAHSLSNIIFFKNVTCMQTIHFCILNYDGNTCTNRADRMSKVNVLTVHIIHALLCVTLYVFSFHACCKEVISVLWLSHPKSTTEFHMSVRGCVRLLHSWQEFAVEVFRISGPATKITQNKHKKKLASDISIQSVNAM